MQDREFLTAEILATRLRVSVFTIRDWTDKGWLPVIRFTKRSPRYEWSEVCKAVLRIQTPACVDNATREEISRIALLYEMREWLESSHRELLTRLFREAVEEIRVCFHKEKRGSKSFNLPTKLEITLKVVAGQTSEPGTVEFAYVKPLFTKTTAN